jgi:misacylated tRNA(Ala) deacylase
MSSLKLPAFLRDAYMASCEGRVVDLDERGGIVLDDTNFYATSGGQPGDCGYLQRENGARVEIAATVKGEQPGVSILVPAAGQALPGIGDTVVGHVDWPRRHRLMRMHTACHVLSVVCPFPITSANVGEQESRIDFDIPDAGVTKEEITGRMMAIISANHPVWSQWIDETELDANPDIVRSKNVRPPRGVGRIRLVCIGENAAIDSQPCGGTHIRETAEIGEVHIGKIEKKGRENRRFRIRFGPPS